MKADRRQNQQTLIENIQTRQNTYEIQQFIELLNLLLEDSKETLLACTAEEFPRVQGEAQTYEKILRMLNRPSLKNLHTRSE